MAVTQEFIDQVSEALMVLGDALENAEGYPRGAEVIIDEEEISNNLSVPGVMYDDDPAINNNARATAYVQIPWSVLSRVLAGMKEATEHATEVVADVDEIVEAAENATTAANNAATNANTKASLANTAAANADSSRQAIEANESTRQSNETTRQSNESGRVTAESGRVTAESGRVSAENSRVSAETARETQASSDHTRADNDHTAIEASLTAAGNVNAELEGMTVTITNREGQATSVNIGFEIYTTYGSVAAMNADAANVPQGKFVMIATTDPTSAENARLYARNSNPAGSTTPFTFLSDLDQASSSAWADWLNNMKPQIEERIATADSDHSIATADHTTASTDHTTAANDHSTAESDHTRAESDHSTASTDHSTASTDHSTAESDHTRAETDHSTADSDHTTATDDHTTATSDHGIATSDHTTASTDHGTAEDDHTIATSDHTTAGSDHTQAGLDHTASVTATTNANNMAGYAENVADHPTYIADGTSSFPGDIGYVYNWDYANQRYVRGVMVTLNWDTMSQAEKDAIAAEMLANIAFDDVPTENSNKAARSSGIYTAIEDAKAGINAKIPTEATQQNQLADKAWVNTQVTTNAPNHISDNGEPFASLEALQQYSGTVTNNDYAFVKTTDAGGNPILQHYRYNVTQWVFEYSFLTGREAATNAECVNIISELI